MPGIGGMDPTLMPQQTEAPKIPKGANPDLYQDGVQKNGQTEQPVSVFHSLDNQPQDGKVDYNEAKNSIFSHMNSAGREGTINISSGSHSIKSMFTRVAEKFNGVQYETTDAGVKNVDAEIASRAENINSYVTQLYDMYLQQRDQEAKTEIIKQEGQLDTKVYRDAAGKIFKSETVEGKTENTFNERNQILTSETRNENGEVIDSSSNTYNESGQRTSRTYTSNGEKLTSTYTYHENGEMATETVTNANGEVVEEATYDENGNETSLNIKLNDTTLNQTTTYDKKGEVKSFTRTDSMNDGSASSTTQSNYKNGNLRYQQTSFATNDENAPNSSFTTSTKFRKDGSIKEQRTTAVDQEGDKFSLTDRFKKDGMNKSSRVGMTNADGDSVEIKGKDWQVTAENSNIEYNSVASDKDKPFDFKGKTPSGYTEIKGYKNHYYNGNGQVFSFTEGENGKPQAKRDVSSHARMYEARFKMAKEHEEA